MNIMGSYLIFHVLVATLLPFVRNDQITAEELPCKSPQYLQMGMTETIRCKFEKDFFAVLWYNGTDLSSEKPILNYQQHKKTGTGYLSGEYDVYPNGSLVIKNVSLRDDGVFSVAYIKSESEGYTYFNIRVVVIVKPDVPFPLLNFCGNKTRECFRKVDKPFVKCSVRGARPKVTVELMIRTVFGDKNISSNSIITSDGLEYTSTVTAKDVFVYSPLLSFLVCKASSLPGLLRYQESSSLILNAMANVTAERTKVHYIERYHRMQLNCTDEGSGSVVWMKATYGGDLKRVVLIRSQFSSKTFTDIVDSTYSLGAKGSLVVPVVNIEHEGKYFCIYNNGVFDRILAYDIIIIVPASPVIHGCNNEENCTMEVNYKGKLTCSVERVRPRVNLQWKTFQAKDAQIISFHNENLLVEEKGFFFDIFLTTNYSLIYSYRGRLIIECTTDKNDGIFHNAMTTTAVLIVKEPFLTTNPPNSATRSVWFVLVFFIIFFMAISVMTGLVKFWWRRRSPQVEVVRYEGEEMHPMLSTKSLEIQDQARNKATLVCHTDMKMKKRDFLKQLKETYRDQCDKVQPIPYKGDNYRNVENIFVESGIQLLICNDDCQNQQWIELESYESIFEHQRVKSKRRILEGPPGFGKTILTLQFAHDWCISRKNSYMKSIEILIILQLRQIKGKCPIYKAIKQLILPADSQLSESDIEMILMSAKSVVIVLDGFDEYNHEDDSSSDITKIIGRKMFQNYEVLLTTRASFLPREYPPSTQRIKLTGFDDISRTNYIKKSFQGDEKTLQQITGMLTDNRTLHDLCQIPLLFVLFSHMVHENEVSERLDSVTRFFRFIISCIYSHMERKSDGTETLCSIDFFESQNDHHEIDKIAFTALKTKGKCLVWEKNELSQLLGQKFYKQYVRIGIFLESQVQYINNDRGALASELIKKKTEVRFFHKLFCEWYAANYLCKLLKDDPYLSLDELLQDVNPADVHYFYRFSCGLDNRTGQKIIRCLINTGYNECAIFCMLEQAGDLQPIVNSLSTLCKMGIIISGHDSLLLQRASIWILSVATAKRIAISEVNLHNCLESVCLADSFIMTRSGLKINANTPVDQLTVTMTNQEMERTKFVSLLEFSTKVSSLCRIGFGGFVPPRFLKRELRILATLQQNGVQVGWRLFTDFPIYVLNLEEGEWEEKDNHRKLTKVEFNRMKRVKTEVMKRRTDKINATLIRRARQELRGHAGQKTDYGQP